MQREIAAKLKVDYVDVIVGLDLFIRNGKLECRSEFRVSSDKSFHGLKALLKNDPIRGREMAQLIIKNSYRTLMTRGMKGCFIFSTDKETRKLLNKIVS